MIDSYKSKCKLQIFSKKLDMECMVCFALKYFGFFSFRFHFCRNVKWHTLSQRTSATSRTNIYAWAVCPPVLYTSPTVPHLQLYSLSISKELQTCRPPR